MCACACGCVRVSVHVLGGAGTDLPSCWARRGKCSMWSRFIIIINKEKFPLPAWVLCIYCKYHCMCVCMIHTYPLSLCLTVGLPACLSVSCLSYYCWLHNHFNGSNHITTADYLYVCFRLKDVMQRTGPSQWVTRLVHWWIYNRVDYTGTHSHTYKLKWKTIHAAGKKKSTISNTVVVLLWEIINPSIYKGGVLLGRKGEERVNLMEFDVGKGKVEWEEEIGFLLERVRL